MFKHITLEVSLKPFKQTDDAYVTEVVRQIFDHWKPLLKNRKTISLMLWTADGSQILDYAGNLDDSFEWAMYVGNANLPLYTEADRPDINLYRRKRPYIENPPKMTYRVLQKIIRIIKEEGRKYFPDSTIRVGETFDIGGEFAYSDFKYHRHTEVCPESQYTANLVDCTATLNADTRPYAAYPNGIPQDTPFGTFFGKQCNIYLKDMDFDYVWLSNGVGFSVNPWEHTGKVYDGKNFYPEKLAITKGKVFGFWKLFREACPNYPVETRGTNHSVGIDYATDGVALYDLYNSNLNFTPPPNSPWAALNGDFGIEIMGHMTRICELPEDEFMFRYYLHDPWWANSPWYDRYGGQAHDIYLPMAISRIDENGVTRSADILNILSIDNAFGDMPDACVYEPLPHLLKAEKDSADAPAPLVWVYPVREFTSSSDADTLYEMYWGDQYIRHAINNGFPLNCVVSTDIFLKTDLSLYEKSILISPVPQSQEIADRLAAFEAKGGHVIYYGSIEKKSDAFSHFVDFKSDPNNIRIMLEEFGYSIRFKTLADYCGSNVITIAAKDNSLLFNVHNPCLTNETLLKFPLGAPILTGTETEIRDGYAVYHFGKCEHRECRVYVQQESGIVCLSEIAPVSTIYHRKLSLGGLKDAIVYIFPENRQGTTLAVDLVPDEIHDTSDPDHCYTRIDDPRYGVYYKAEHLSGSHIILLPK